MEGQEVGSENTENVNSDVSDKQENKPVEETAEELKQRLENAKAENARKAERIRELTEQVEARTRQETAAANTTVGGVNLAQYGDHELKAALKDPNHAALHENIEEELHLRRIRRINAAEQEQNLRLNSELERQKQFPETLDPTHPMAVKMSELMHSYRLQNNPAGRLLAARLASSELQQQKAVAAGRKQEQDRQADVKASFQGESSRPAPKASDRVKLEELKKRAMSGDPAAKAEWFKQRGLI